MRCKRFDCVAGDRVQRMAAVNNVASVEEEGRERASGTHHLRARAPVKGLRAVR